MAATCTECSCNAIVEASLHCGDGTKRRGIHAGNVMAMFHVTKEGSTHLLNREKFAFLPRLSGIQGGGYIPACMLSFEKQGLLRLQQNLSKLKQH